MDIILLFSNSHSTYRIIQGTLCPRAAKKQVAAYAFLQFQVTEMALAETAAPVARELPLTQKRVDVGR